MPYIGAKIKEAAVAEIEKSLKRWLPNEEFIVAFFKISHYKPLTDVVVVTNQRIISVYIDGIKRNKGFPSEIVADDIQDVVTTRFTDDLIITMWTT